jgi:hypothetical protein
VVPSWRPPLDPAAPQVLVPATVVNRQQEGSHVRYGFAFALENLPNAEEITSAIADYVPQRQVEMIRVLKGMNRTRAAATRTHHAFLSGPDIEATSSSGCSRQGYSGHLHHAGGPPPHISPKIDGGARVVRFHSLAVANRSTQSRSSRILTSSHSAMSSDAALYLKAASA